MHSPFQAVYGHDRTHVKRMTVGEYLQEIDDEERDLRGEAPRGDKRQTWQSCSVNTSAHGHETPPQYELRRAALSSKDPRVAFSSKYPMYDRLGRELCVLYQVQDLAVEAEIQRLQRDGDSCRRSGVRLSAELKLDSTTSRVTATSRVGGRQILGVDEDVDVTVSTMSHTSSFMPSRPMSARPSEFSIYRDSAKPALMARASAVAAANNKESMDASNCCRENSSKKMRSAPAISAYNHPGTLAAATPGTARSSERTDFRGHSQPPPLRWAASGIGELDHENAADKENCVPNGDGAVRHHRHVVVPMPPLPADMRLRKLVDKDSDRGLTSRSRSRSGRQRSQSHKRTRGAANANHHMRSGSAPPSCAVVMDEKCEDQENGGKKARREDEKGDTHSAEGDSEESSVEEAEDVSREVGTGDGAKVEDDERTRNKLLNLVDPVRFTMTRESTASRITKQLFRATAGAASRSTTTVSHSHPIDSSAYGLGAATIPASMVFAEIEKNFANCGALSGTFENHADAELPELRCGSVVQLGGRWFQLISFFLVAEVYEVVEVDPRPQSAPVAAAAAAEQHDTLDARQLQQPATAPVAGGDCNHNNSSAEPTQLPNFEEEKPVSAGATKEETSVQWLPPAPGSNVRCQRLLYRWRGRSTPYRGNEARRAAAGLCLCAPEVCVSGYAYAGGAGLTLLTMPEGYRAAPLSGLPLTPPSYRTLLKLVLRYLSSTVARRLIHGNLVSLGEMLIAFPKETERGAAAPLLFPVHWERTVDFSMFVDRSAGRTIPFDAEDGSEQPLLTLGKDISSVLSCFLAHMQAAALTSEQYVLLQKLIVMAAAPTPVANHLVQLKNLASALPTDFPALRQAYEAAVIFYDS